MEVNRVKEYSVYSYVFGVEEVKSVQKVEDTFEDLRSPPESWNMIGSTVNKINNVIYFVFSSYSLFNMFKYENHINCIYLRPNNSISVV